MSWLESLNTFLQNSGNLITAFATLLLAGITYWYVRLMQKYVRVTQENVQLTQEILKAANKPEIILYLSPEVGVMNLCIENIGIGYALNIKFTVDYSRNPTPPSAEMFENSDICKNGIGYLGQAHKEKVLLFFLDDMPNLPKHLFNITATYKDSADTEHKKTFKFEIGNWKNISQFRTPQVSDVALALQNINETLKSLTPQSHKENSNT